MLLVERPFLLPATWPCWPVLALMLVVLPQVHLKKVAAWPEGALDPIQLAEATTEQQEVRVVPGALCATVCGGARRAVAAARVAPWIVRVGDTGTWPAVAHPHAVAVSSVWRKRTCPPCVPPAHDIPSSQSHHTAVHAGLPVTSSSIATLWLHVSCTCYGSLLVPSWQETETHAERLARIARAAAGALAGLWQVSEGGRRAVGLAHAAREGCLPPTELLTGWTGQAKCRNAIYMVH